MTHKETKLSEEGKLWIAHSELQFEKDFQEMQQAKLSKYIPQDATMQYYKNWSKKKRRNNN